MRTLRKILPIFILFIIVAGLTSFYTESNADLRKMPKADQDEEEPEMVHWFYLRMKVNERTNSYTIIGTGSRVISGTPEEFEKALWWGTKHGQMTIGPFLKNKEATEARLLYRRSRSKITMSSDHHDEVHWFLITFKEMKRAGSYRLMRMPARLASGKQEEFLDALYEGMTFKHLAIGPFWDYVNAEEAKALYRKNE